MQGRCCQNNSRADITHSAPQLCITASPCQTESGINSPAAALVVAGHVTDGCCVPSCANLLVKVSIAAGTVVDGPAKGQGGQAGARAEGQKSATSACVRLQCDLERLAGRIAERSFHRSFNAQTDTRR